MGRGGTVFFADSGREEEVEPEEQDKERQTFGEERGVDELHPDGAKGGEDEHEERERQADFEVKVTFLVEMESGGKTAKRGLELVGGEGLERRDSRE